METKEILRQLKDLAIEKFHSNEHLTEEISHLKYLTFDFLLETPDRKQKIKITKKFKNDEIDEYEKVTNSLMILSENDILLWSGSDYFIDWENEEKGKNDEELISLYKSVAFCFDYGYYQIIYLDVEKEEVIFGSFSTSQHHKYVNLINEIDEPDDPKKPKLKYVEL